MDDKINEKSLVQQLSYYKKKSKDLENKVNNLQDVIDAVPAYIYWKDRDGIWLGCNKSEFNALSKALNEDGEALSKLDIIGKTNHDLFDEEYATILTDNDEYVMENGRDHMFEETFNHGDGSTQYFFSLKSPRKDSSGKVVGLIGAAFDISEQKVLEEELKIALEKASTDAKAKKSFIDSLSHDIRTPLTGILGLIEIIKDKSENNPEVFIYSSILVDATKSFLNFFNDIIETVEESENNDVLINSVVSLKEIVNECMLLFLPAATQKKIKIKTTGFESLPKYINTNKRILMRVLTNLIGNAIKFTEKGEVKIHYSRDVNNLNNLRVTISDTGIGIPSDFLEKIFDRFTQVNSKNIGSYKGAGLGLFMVKKYVESLGGTITVDSMEGIGSSFIVMIPIEFQDSVVLGSNAVNDDLSDSEIYLCQQIRNKKILIIEDNDLAAFALKNMLDIYQHEVDLASDGKEAVDKLALKQYDIVFLDQDLPYLSGREVLDEFKKHESCKDTIFIMLSGHLDKSEKIPGCHEQILKPMQKNILVRIINKYFH
jgi:two-component system aerobic respiration control sensor histidine kinase ArcB